MFFSPTVLALTAPELNNQVKILCLSSGDADGLGEVRKKELAESGVALGLKGRGDVHVVESEYVILIFVRNAQRLRIGQMLTMNSDFPDSMTARWPSPIIADLLESAFAPPPKPSKSRSAKSPSSSTKSPKSDSESDAPSTPPKTNIDVLLTFDRSGISSHPNHISLYHGARLFIDRLLKRYPDHPLPIHLYTLRSVPIHRKYVSLLDVPYTFLRALASSIPSKIKFRLPFTKSLAGKKEKAAPKNVVFVSGPEGIRKGQKAMTTAHVSQMRWFRWGWIGLSRYMVVNDLRLEDGPLPDGAGRGKAKATDADLKKTK
jgi:N-acetylglucosaminylphosphatidylinositol deacetylase